MIRRRGLLPAWGLAALAACTPIGLWVWEEPAVEVARVRLEDTPRAGSLVTDSSVTVALYIWNPNDYDLSTARFELRLRLDGETVGHYERDSIIPLTRTETATLSLPFSPARGTTRSKLERFKGGTHKFAVEGRAVLVTPFGERPVRVAHAGDIAFGGDVEPVSGGDARRPDPGLPMPNRWPAVWRGPEPRNRR